jgi:hypothetical protein
MATKTKLILSAIKKVLLIALDAALEAVFGHLGSESIRKITKKKKRTKKKPVRKKKEAKGGVSNP